MPQVLSRNPNASTNINGIAFTKTAKGMLSEEITQEQADYFLSIKGYVAVKAAPIAPVAPTPDPAAEAAAAVQAAAAQAAAEQAAAVQAAAAAAAQAEAQREAAEKNEGDKDAQEKQ